MKPTLLTTLFFLLFALTTYFPLAFTITIEQVKDKNGNPVLLSKKYFIWPANGDGGGLKLNETGPLECPLVVKQDFSQAVKSLPLSFIPTEKINDFIFTSFTSLDIVFEKKTKCAESSKWVIVKGDSHEPWIGIGGIEKHNGKSIIDGLFKIETLGFGYKLVFCPTISDPPGLCNNIGRYPEDENGMRLIMSEYFQPFEVVFVDVDASGKYVV